MPGAKPIEVSAVIPAHNAAHTIERALRSALAQTAPLREILVIDDGSSDDTADRARNLGKNVRVIQQSNAGAPAARNRGLREAQADLAAFLDADDEWLPTWIERATARFAADPTLGMAWAHLWRIHPDGSREIYGRQFDRYLVFPGYFWPSARHQTSATAVRRSIALEVGAFDESLRSREDQDLWIRIRERASVAEIAEPLAIYHETHESLSKTTDLDRVRREYFEILERGMKRRPDLYEPYRSTILAQAHWHWGLKFLAAGRGADARHHMARSLRHRFHPRIALALAGATMPRPIVSAARRWIRSRGRLGD